MLSHLLPNGSGEFVSSPLDAAVERLFVVALADGKGLEGGREGERERSGCVREGERERERVTGRDRGKKMQSCVWGLSVT